MKIGRISKEWRKIRNDWIQNNPPNHQGAWVCYLCGAWVYKEDMELDHVEPRGSLSTHVANNPDNLSPTHRWCNREKGSSHITAPRRVNNRPEVW